MKFHFGPSWHNALSGGIWSSTINDLERNGSFGGDEAIIARVQLRNNNCIDITLVAYSGRSPR